MDTATLTHVGAIVVGVVVTLLLVSSSRKKVEVPVAPAAAESNNTTAVTTKDKPVKKKEKKRNVSSKQVSGTSNVPNDRSVPEPVNEEPPAPAPEGKKKKKKKKAKANKGTSDSTATDTKKEEPKEAPEEVVPPPAPKPRPQPPIMIQPVEEDWIVERPRKKKNRSLKPKVAKPTPVSISKDTVVIDAKKVGIIIGPKGATMKAIEEATGCKLDVNAPSKDDPPPKGNTPQKAAVVLSGDKAAVLKAKTAIEELASKGYATILQSDGFGEFSIMVHPRNLSEIVGSGGKVIQALQKECDVKLTIPPTSWKPNSTQTGKVPLCSVGIAGSKDNAKKAKAVIQALTEFHHHPITHPGMVHEETYVPSEFFHCVIGPRGSEIRHMRGNYKVDVYMPNSDTKTENVLVVGRQANVDKAILYIHMLMDRDSESREKKYTDEYY